MKKIKYAILTALITFSLAAQAGSGFLQHKPSNEDLKPFVTANSITVTDDNTIASTDMYVDANFNLTNQAITFSTHNQAYDGSFDGNFFQTDQGTPWVLRARLPWPETAPTVIVKHSGAPATNTLRVIATTKIDSNEMSLEFVTTGASAGYTHFTTSDGLDWPVRIVTETNPGWPVRFDDINGGLIYVNSDIPGNPRGVVVHPATGNIIIVEAGGSGVGAAVFFNPASTETERLNGTFGDTSDHTFEMNAYNSTNPGTFLVPLYIVPTAAEGSRLQHNIAQLPVDIEVPNVFANQSVRVVYSANAAVDGYRLRYVDGFKYNNTSTGTPTDTEFYTSTTQRPSQEVKAQQ